MFNFYRLYSKQLIASVYDRYMQQHNIHNGPSSIWKIVKYQQRSRQSRKEIEYEGKLVTGKDAANAFLLAFFNVSF